MIQFMLYSSMIIAGMIFMQMNHPLAMGLMLLVQTTMVCLASGFLAKTFWFSYVLFLIFLGGMLVLFIYVTSLASNEMFSMSMKLSMAVLIMFMVLLMSTLIMDKTLIMSFSENNEMTQLSNQINFIKEDALSLTKLYNFPTNMMTLLLINYLLVTLIAIVKITNVFYGPLRQMI